MVCPSSACPVSVEADGTLPNALGENTGFTRRLGTDLSNDHPISFRFDTTLAIADGELRDPSTSAHIGVRQPGVNPLVPLDNNNAEVQCNSCHVMPLIRAKASSSCV